MFSVVFKVADLGGLEQDGEIRDVHEAEAGDAPTSAPLTLVTVSKVSGMTWCAPIVVSRAPFSNVPIATRACAQ